MNCQHNNLRDYLDENGDWVIECLDCGHLVIYDRTDYEEEICEE